MDAEGLLKLYLAPFHWPPGLPFTAIFLSLNNSPEPLPVRMFWKPHSLWRHRNSVVWIADWLGTKDFLNFQFCRMRKNALSWTASSYSCSELFPLKFSWFCQLKRSVDFWMLYDNPRTVLSFSFSFVLLLVVNKTWLLNDGLKASCLRCSKLNVDHPLLLVW